MKGYLIAAIFAAFIAGAAGGYVKGAADSNAQAKIDAKQATIDRMGVWLKAANEARSTAEALAAESRASADARLKELTHVKAENSRLRDDVDRGSVRLTLAGTCAGAEPHSRADGRVDHGGACELAASARPAYFALRDGIGQQRSQLLAAQDRIRALERHARVCAAGEPP